MVRMQEESYKNPKVNLCYKFVAYVHFFSFYLLLHFKKKIRTETKKKETKLYLYIVYKAYENLCLENLINK